MSEDQDIPKEDSKNTKIAESANENNVPPAVPKDDSDYTDVSPMNNDQKILQEHSDHAASHPDPNPKEGKPPPENQKHHKPAISNQKSETTPQPEPQPVNMEVHKHPHHVTHKKKWAEYLLEFIMIFLAVFLGFVAENYRERQVEKERSKELAHSFYDELKTDSIAFHTVLQNRQRKNASFVHLKKYFLDSSLRNCSKTFAIDFSYCFATFSPSVFEPKDAILQQLKNSGSLRYFKNPGLQKQIGALSVDIADLRSRNQIELDYTQQNLMPFFIEHNDQQWFDKLGLDSNVFLVNKLREYEMSNEIIPFNFKKAENLDRDAAANMIGLYQIIFRGSLLRQYEDYERLNHELLETLRKEYYID
jgi:hypothetical protein